MPPLTVRTEPSPRPTTMPPVCGCSGSREVTVSGQPATTLPHLEVFCKAAELASFTKAAKALGMTQAAVSQHVRALEGELGVSLFHRRAGRVELSEAGKTLYGYAQRILALHSEARTALGKATPRLKGQVSVAAWLW